jgi:hypothetical protein
VIGTPFGVGAVQETVAWPLPATAVTPVGTPGTPISTAFEGADSGVLTWVMGVVGILTNAITLKVYVVPFVSPVTVCVVAVLLKA